MRNDDGTYDCDVCLKDLGTTPALRVKLPGRYEASWCEDHIPQPLTNEEFAHLSKLISDYTAELHEWSHEAKSDLIEDLFERLALEWWQRKHDDPAQ